MSIACVHIPRFAVEAERQRRPDIAARLILIGEATVLDCSLGADPLGVLRGIRMSEAIALCHKAVVLSPDAPYCQRLFDEVLGLLNELSPSVEAGEIGTSYVSLDGFDVEAAAFADGLISSLHRRLGFMASVGIADGKFAARVVAATSRPGTAKTVESGDEASFLAPLPCSYLPASEAMLWRLKLLGLETIGDVTQLPLGAFQQQFGPEGKRCWELANGIDEEPIVPRVTESTVVRRMQLPATTASLETIMAGLERLLVAAYGDRARQGHWVRKAIVRGALDGGGAWELPIAFREALADPKAAWFAIRSAVTRHPPERLLEELEIELVGLSGESGKQAPMFESKGKLWQQVEEAARHLNTNGRRSIGRIVEVEPWSRIPERRTALEDFAS
jgi:nucleotidyltransferase/DNA polymerase involved in DNA repair